MSYPRWMVALPIIASLASNTEIANGADDAWSDIKKSIYQDRPIATASNSSLALYAPAQAADGAMVPVSIHVPPAVAAKSARLTIIIDRNPAPVAAVIKFGEGWRRGGNIGDRIFATRLRIDSFSIVRAVLETDEGHLLMAEKFVAGAGGCSALPSKDPDAVLADMGRSKLTATSHATREPEWREGVVMIRHPNFTGMQLNPETGKYTPARYLSDIVIGDGQQTMFEVEGSISLSEDPNFRFTYSGTTNHLEMRAVDSDGLKITGTTADAPS